MAGAEEFLGAPEKVSRLGKASRIVGGLSFLRGHQEWNSTLAATTNAPNPAQIYIDENGNPDTEWICAYHRDKWNADRARFLADRVPCEMKEL